jgi:hypothetical protein
MNLSRGAESETDSSFKLAITPYFTDTLPTVTIESAQTIDSGFEQGDEWNTNEMGRLGLGTVSSGVNSQISGESTGTDSTVTRQSRSRTR